MTILLGLVITDKHVYLNRTDKKLFKHFLSTLLKKYMH